MSEDQRDDFYDQRDWDEYQRGRDDHQCGRYKGTWKFLMAFAIKRRTMVEEESDIKQNKNPQTR